MGFNNNNNYYYNNNYNYNIRAEVETHTPKLHDSFYFSPALPSLTSYGPLSHELYKVLRYPWHISSYNMSECHGTYFSGTAYLWCSLLTV